MSPYPTIVPYLAVADADAAIDFYKRAFGAEETMRVPGPDGRGIMHAEVLVNGGHIMLTDPFPEGGFTPPGPGERAPVGIMVQWSRPEEVDAMFRRAVEAGGTAETEPRNEPWGRASPAWSIRSASAGGFTRPWRLSPTSTRRHSGASKASPEPMTSLPPTTHSRCGPLPKTLFVGSGLRFAARNDAAGAPTRPCRSLPPAPRRRAQNRDTCHRW